MYEAVAQIGVRNDVDVLVRPGVPAGDDVTMPDRTRLPIVRWGAQPTLPGVRISTSSELRHHASAVGHPLITALLPDIG